jgi:hypothetical protein
MAAAAPPPPRLLARSASGAASAAGFDVRQSSLLVAAGASLERRSLEALQAAAATRSASLAALQDEPVAALLPVLDEEDVALVASGARLWRVGRDHSSEPCELGDPAHSLWALAGARGLAAVVCETGHVVVVDAMPRIVARVERPLAASPVDVTRSPRKGKGTTARVVQAGVGALAGKQRVLWVITPTELLLYTWPEGDAAQLKALACANLPAAASSTAQFVSFDPDSATLCAVDAAGRCTVFAWASQTAAFLVVPAISFSVAPADAAQSDVLDCRVIAPAVLAVLSRARGGHVALALWECRFGTLLHATEPAREAGAAEEADVTRSPKKRKRAATGSSRPRIVAPPAGLAKPRWAAAVVDGAVAAWPLPGKSAAAPALADVLGKEESRASVGSVLGGSLALAPLVALAESPADALAQWNSAMDAAEEEEAKVIALLREPGAKSAAAAVAALVELVRARRVAAGVEQDDDPNASAEAAGAKGKGKGAPRGGRAASAKEASEGKDAGITGRKRRRPATTLPLSAGFVAQAVAESLRNDRPPNWGVLDALLSSNCFPGALAVRLVRALAEHQRNDLLKKVLFHVHDLPERALVSVLQYALDSCAAAATTAKPADSAADDVSAEQLVQLVLSAPRSDALLQQQLGQLSTQHVLSLLRVLFSWVERYWLKTDRAVQAESRTRCPTFGQVLDWLGLVLDSHYAMLLSLPEAQQLISQLAFLVTQQHVALCERLEPLVGVIKQLQQPQQTPREQVPDYSIEAFAL